MYDYLIVGAGLYGAVFAQQMVSAGKKCLVIDRRSHVAGNAYTETISGINVHKYGAHIFHTNDQDIWRYVNKFAEFNHFVNCPIAVYKGKRYNLPFNMNTFVQMWGIRTPEEAKEKIASQVSSLNITEPKNLEEQALCLVGSDVYRRLVKGYTEKQWGRDCKDLPAFIIKRLPCRFTYNNNYFNDRYQGIPVGGYTPMVERMLQGADVRLNTDYFDLIRNEPNIAKKTVFTGCIDEFFNYRLGTLSYRSVYFETEELPMENFQGNAVINYTERKIPYTRTIEHKHFEFGNQPTTIVSREYFVEWRPGMEPSYPINDAKNSALYEKYKRLAARQKNVLFGGRLGRYQYLDMDKVIRLALDDARTELAE